MSQLGQVTHYTLITLKFQLCYTLPDNNIFTSLKNADDDAGSSNSNLAMRPGLFTSASKLISACLIIKRTLAHSPTNVLDLLFRTSIPF